MNKTKRQHTEWERMFINDTFDKGLLPKFIKNSYYSAPENKQSN